MKNQTFNILVADDDEAIRFLVAALLRRHGHIVEAVDNGSAAMELFTVKPDYFDVLITDHNMPLMSGLELVHYVRKSGAQARIIVMSSALNDELMSAYESKHVDKILQKPFSIQHLSSSLNDILMQWKRAAGT